jgi:hypothetical protein
MTSIRNVLAATAGAILLPFAAPAAAEWKNVGGEIAFVPGAPSVKTRDQHKAELAQMRADGTLQRYQTLRFPPPYGVRHAKELRQDLQRPTAATPAPQRVSDLRTIYTGA